MNRIEKNKLLKKLKLYNILTLVLTLMLLIIILGFLQIPKLGNFDDIKTIIFLYVWTIVAFLIITLYFNARSQTIAMRLKKYKDKINQWRERHAYQIVINSIIKQDFYRAKTTYNGFNWTQPEIKGYLTGVYYATMMYSDDPENSEQGYKNIERLRISMLPTEDQ